MIRLRMSYNLLANPYVSMMKLLLEIFLAALPSLTEVTSKH
jgi:hypothetical protein